MRTEYSEENLLFWLACQDYKKLFGGTEMAAAAKRIYAEFVQVDAPRQVRHLGRLKPADFQTLSAEA